jgi:hypothetical protein
MKTRWLLLAAGLAALPWTTLADTVTLAPVADTFTYSVNPNFAYGASYYDLELIKTPSNDSA